jgi:hypothetical protein
MVDRYPATDVDAIWREALRASWRTEQVRAGGASPDAHPLHDRVQELRRMLQGELVAFHKTLVATPYSGSDYVARPEKRLVDIAVPITLFPKRSRGFCSVNCVVDFTDGDDFRVVGVAPPPRHEAMAVVQIGAALNFDAQAALGLPMPAAAGTSVTEVSAKVYGHVQAASSHRAIRRVVEAEIVKGTGARWRLENTSDPLTLEAESHRLGVIAEVAKDAKNVNAAGYLEAISDPQWLTASISDVIDHIAAALRQFLRKGAPLQAFAEWRVELPSA